MQTNNISAIILFLALIMTMLAVRVVATAEVQQLTTPFQLISATELKEKVMRKEAVTILDVRSTSSYSNSDGKIKGAIHLKLRRLKFRLSFPPLKDLARDSYVVTYCSCPNDEASLRAAQILVDAGFTRVRVLKGGWNEWLKNTGPVEARSKGM